MEGQQQPVSTRSWPGCARVTRPVVPVAEWKQGQPRAVTSAGVIGRGQTAGSSPLVGTALGHAACRGVEAQRRQGGREEA